MKENQGWISLHRKIQDNPHWLKERFTKMQAWIDLILLANYEDKEVFVDYKPITIKRGQCITSQAKLAKRWRWDRQTVKRFLTCATNEKMLIHECHRGYENGFTVITILNYDEYQQVPQPMPQGMPQGNHRACHITNNNNNDNNIYIMAENKKNNLPSLEEKKQTGVQTVADILANRLQTTQPVKGIYTPFQDKAFRYAKALGIDLTDKELGPEKLKSRWIRMFKLADGNATLNAKVEKAYSYLIDYAPFKAKTNLHKIKYFFEIANNYQLKK